MEVGKISDGIQATIDLLGSIPVRAKDLETVGFGILTALKNLEMIKEAVIKAENGESFDDQNQPDKENRIDSDEVGGIE